jgi:hypothetical protein
MINKYRKMCDMCKSLCTYAIVIISLIEIPGIADAQRTTTAIKQSLSPKVTEGIVYSRTSFPDHPLNDSLRKLDFESGDFLKQHNVIQDLKKHQQSYKSQNEQEIKDAFFVSGIIVTPAYSKMYFTPSKTLVKTDALGYHQQLLVDTKEQTGRLIIADNGKDNEGTINFNMSDLLEVWQKYQINAEQYTIQKSTETAVVAGYTCKKVTYTFSGTSRGLPVSNYIINLQPEKVTAWVTDDLPASLNIMHPHYFELSQAVLKYEVELDRNKKNKMLIEVTRLEPRKIDDDELEVKKTVPVIQHTRGSYDSGTRIMQVMMSAISLLQ